MKAKKATYFYKHDARIREYVRVRFMAGDSFASMIGNPWSYSVQGMENVFRDDCKGARSHRASNT